MRRFLFRGLAVLTVVAALAGCQLPHGPESAPVTPAGNRESPVISIEYEPMPIARHMEGQDGIVRLTMTGQGFDPSDLRVSVGGKVKLHVVNQDSRVHNLVVGRFGIVTAPVRPGGETYVEFTAGQKGSWPFVSDLPGEAEPGYQGVLQVE